MLAISGAVAVDVPAGEPSLTGMNDPAELAAARRAG
jgi:hypothetical protein